MSDSLKEEWKKQLAKATQLDDWGQIVEAQDEYQKLAMSIGQTYGVLQSSEKEIAHRIVLCLSARVQAIQDLSERINAQDMKKLDQTINHVLGSQAVSTSFSATATVDLSYTFPIPAYKFQDVTHIIMPLHGTPGGPAGSEVYCEETATPSDFQHTHAMLSNVNGTLVSVKVLKMGIKDAETYIDPFLTILVADARGKVIDTHDVPAMAERSPQYVHFQHIAYLRISLEDMQRNQCSIFYEFKHYKPKKKKVSTRCWCFMEMNELKPDQESVLEIYHKPTDLAKKKLKLHSVKSLYFHLIPTLAR